MSKKRLLRFSAKTPVVFLSVLEFIPTFAMSHMNGNLNYRIHTDAIKSHLIPQEVTPMQASLIYAEETDVLNVAMFGMTAKQ